MRRPLLIVLGVVLFAGAGIAAWFALSPAPVPTAIAKAEGFAVTDYDRTMGDPKAPIVLIEYAAPICPHCAAFDMNGFPALKAGYIDTGKVFYVFRVYPLRPDDGPAEKLARCAPKDKYFYVMDQLFRNQPKWDGTEYPGVSDDHAGLLLVARIAGMPQEQAEKCMSSTELDQSINRVAQEGEQRYNIGSTPTFVINGVPAPAGEEWAGLKRLLDAALSRKHP